MNNTFNDGLTNFITTKISDFEYKIYEMEDNIRNPKKDVEEIIEYLKNVNLSISFGRALRRFICNRYGTFDEAAGQYVFDLIEGEEIRVEDYHQDDYDLTKTDVAAFTALFLAINSKFNTDSDGKLWLNFPKNEAKRLLQASSPCRRDKMFFISFALHMNSDETKKFLNDVLAEQTYNFRNPNEIIAYYCQCNEERNSYQNYCSLKQQYEQMVQISQPGLKMEKGYTVFATWKVNTVIENDEQLLHFMIENAANFIGYSQTAYEEFVTLLTRAKELTTYQALLNDEYISDTTAYTREQYEQKVDRINSSIESRQVMNNEQLAREMLACIPRYSKKYVRELKDKNGNKTGETLKVVEHDFIAIRNGESGQEKEKRTTILPKQITKNLLMSDRLNALEKQRKPVERKDLVFLFFYVFSKKIEEKGSYTAKDYNVFIDECNAMLNRCGMSNLYPANQFENLIFLSLLASNPFEMFETIIEYSFFNEPSEEEVSPSTGDGE